MSLFDESENRSLSNVERLILRSIFKSIDLKKNFWQVYIIDKVIKIVKNMSIYLKLIEYASNSIKMIKIDSIYWLQFIRNIDVDTINYQIFDENAIKRHDYLKNMFNNIDYQRQNIETFCYEIDISWTKTNTIFRMLKIILFVNLKFWQSTKIKFFKNMKKFLLFHDCILTNYIKLNKIWIVIVFFWR